LQLDRAAFNGQDFYLANFFAYANHAVIYHCAWVFAVKDSLKINLGPFDRLWLWNWRSRRSCYACRSWRNGLLRNNNWRLWNWRRRHGLRRRRLCADFSPRRSRRR
jgi:hypothetical protein